MYCANIEQESLIIDIIIEYYFKYHEQDDFIKSWLSKTMSKWRYERNENEINQGADAFIKSKELHRKKYHYLDYTYQACIDNFVFNISYHISKLRRQLELLYEEFCIISNILEIDKNKAVNTIFWSAYSCPRDF
jgi:hypothetical protein